MKNKTATAYSPTKRLLGKILIDGSFVTPGDLESALERQKLTNEQVGEILLGMGAVSSTDLKAVLSVQRDLASLNDSIKAAAGIRELLGALLLKSKRITPEQLDSALEEQQRSGEKLGAVLIRLGFLSQQELSTVLSFQQYQGGEGPTSASFKLGEILVATEQITRKQLEDVLVHQKISKKKIGELLIEAGYARPHQIDHGLTLQQKLVTAALVAALSMANAVGVQEAYAGSTTAGAKVTISARVIEHTKMQILNQAQELIVTNADIMRGFVAIPAASRIQVKSNNPSGYLLAFEVMSGSSNIFNSVNVVVGSRDVLLSPGGGWIPLPYIRGGETMNLSYRFALAKGAKPGTYGWPLLVSVQSM